MQDELAPLCVGAAVPEYVIVPGGLEGRVAVVDVVDVVAEDCAATQ